MLNGVIGDLPVSEDDVIDVQKLFNPFNCVVVNGSGDEEKDIANDSGPVCDISVSKLCEGDLNISSHHSDSGFHYISSNSCDTDSECEWSSSNSCDTYSEWELSSQEDCDTDSDFQVNELDHLETPDSDNDRFLRPKPASSTQNDLLQQNKVKRLQQQILRLKKK